ncbi:hypothetical protein J7E63_15665 [Bacillus sp. ISL-75]|uniref:hypothetical protein n=1 Tax=Bacillus sp. ISL-75 TaxID=2819137 RepID=UPI001BEC87D0|nr:hypothetical protein [Bacillus sp. ISL-75]MBT2728368.1 hypothetical protein [Bacillus sp. ISL-75]
MRIYEAKEDEEIVESLIAMIEADTGKEIFTMKILDHTEDGLETIIVFKDQNVLMGRIKVQTINNKMALRMQGNYID